MPFAVPQRVLFDDAVGVMSAGQKAISAGETQIDLAAVTQSDSSLIACLLAWQRAATGAGGKLSILNPPASLRGIAALYGVEVLALE